MGGGPVNADLFFTQVIRPSGFGFRFSFDIPISTFVISIVAPPETPQWALPGGCKPLPDFL
jgi:hypothetical protein